MVKKALKPIIVGVLASVFLVSIFLVEVFAEEVFYGRFSISVDGQPFEVWGVNGIRLQDAAFMLNGTSAQFDIAEPPYGWDFWIRRGEPYTPDGTELQRVSARNPNARLIMDEFSDGYHPAPYFRHGTFGFRGLPHRIIALGLDGSETPAITISLAVANVEDSFFSLHDLAYWLGFELTGDMWDNWRGADYAISMRTRNVSTPWHFIRRDTFPIGTRQVIDYAYVLRVRTGPGNNYDVLTFVERGDEFEILDYNGRFVQIYTNRGKGWIFAGFLSRDLTYERPAATRNNPEILAVLRLIESRGWRDKWVDRAFHYSPIIDESVVFPVGSFFVTPTIRNGDELALSGGISRGWFPISPKIENVGGFGVSTKPVTMWELEPGIVELRYDLTQPIIQTDHGNVWAEAWRERQKEIYENRRIVVDTNNVPVQTIRYYINGVGHDLIRLDESRDPSRYTAEPVNGGIRLAWHLPAWSVLVEMGPLQLYRSTVRGERGMIIRENHVTHGEWNNYRWLYEFIDTNVSDDGTYFYSLWMYDIATQFVRNEHGRYVHNASMDRTPLLIGGEWQMEVSLPLN